MAAKISTLLLVLVFSVSTNSQELSLSDILDLNVSTASKSSEKIYRATSVMSVVTAAQIKRSGARTLYEVLKTVPGYFSTAQATWTMPGSRGLVSDGPVKILLLIDGHPQNSILEQGYQQQDMIPNLSNVERIEISRGPGSVMWGSSAAWGIINVITKSSVEGSGTKATIGYGSADKMKSANVTKGIDFESVKGYVSLDYWRSSGYGKDGTPNVKFAWGAETNQWPDLDEHYPSFELYSKVKFGKDDEFKLRVLDMAVVYPWDSWVWAPSNGFKTGSELRTRKAYLSYTHTRKYSSNLSVDYNLYGDMTLQNRFPHAIQNGATDHRWIEDMSREETALGLDINGSYSLDKHLFSFGAKYVQTKAGPNRSFRFDTETNKPTTPEGTEEQVNIVGVKNGVDKSSSIYVQDKYTFNSGMTDIFAGVRVDDNNWREDKTIFLPRAGFIHEFSDGFSAKYVYNTGYLRPNAVYSKSGGKFYRSPSKTIETIAVVDKSEEVKSHDVQVFYSKGKSYLSVTAFFMEIENYTTWETKLDLGYRNMGRASTRGVELDMSYSFSESFALSTNYSYAKAELRSIPWGVSHLGAATYLEGATTNSKGEWLNYPQHIWNIMFDYIVDDNYTFNMTLRGWENMKIINGYDDYNGKGNDGKLSGERYVDLNFTHAGLAKDLSGSIFVKNLLDNDDVVGMAINNGTYHPRGRNIGGTLSYEF